LNLTDADHGPTKSWGSDNRSPRRIDQAAHRVARLSSHAWSRAEWESTPIIPRTTLSPMAMGKRLRHVKQASMWVATEDLVRSAAHPFYGLQHGNECDVDRHAARDGFQDPAILFPELRPDEHRAHYDRPLD
jgi:hypothetical protein